MFCAKPVDFKRLVVVVVVRLCIRVPTNTAFAFFNPACIHRAPKRMRSVAFKLPPRLGTSIRSLSRIRIAVRSRDLSPLDDILPLIVTPLPSPAFGVYRNTRTAPASKSVFPAPIFIEFRQRECITTFATCFRFHLSRPGRMRDGTGAMVSQTVQRGNRRAACYEPCWICLSYHCTFIVRDLPAEVNQIPLWPWK